MQWHGHTTDEDDVLYLRCHIQRSQGHDNDNPILPTIGVHFLCCAHQFDLLPQQACSMAQIHQYYQHPLSSIPAPLAIWIFGVSGEFCIFSSFWPLLMFLGLLAHIFASTELHMSVVMLNTSVQLLKPSITSGSHFSTPMSKFSCFDSSGQVLTIFGTISIVFVSIPNAPKSLHTLNTSIRLWTLFSTKS